MSCQLQLRRLLLKRCRRFSKGVLSRGPVIRVRPAVPPPVLHPRASVPRPPSEHPEHHRGRNHAADHCEPFLKESLAWATLGRAVGVCEVGVGFQACAAKHAAQAATLLARLQPAAAPAQFVGRLVGARAHIDGEFVRTPVAVRKRHCLQSDAGSITGRPRQWTVHAGAFVHEVSGPAFARGKAGRPLWRLSIVGAGHTCVLAVLIGLLIVRVLWAVNGDAGHTPGAGRAREHHAGRQFDSSGAQQ